MVESKVGGDVNNGFSIMNTSEFEKLIAGNAARNFTSLTNNQTITVV